MVVSMNTAAGIGAIATILSLWCPPDSYHPIAPDHRAEAPGKFVDIGGARTHYIIEGSGPLIVLVHGLGRGAEGFQEMIPILAKDHTVLAYDYYGRGYTDAITENNDLEQLVAHLAQLLLALSKETDGKTVQPFSLLGYSMGGALATGFATQFPHLIKDLILMAPAGTDIPIPVEGQLVKLPILGDIIFSLVARPVLQLQVPRGHYDSEGSAAYQQKTSDYIATQVQKSPGYISSLLSSLRHFPLNDMEDAFRTVQNHSYPILVVWGDSDMVCPYNASFPKLKEMIPRAKFHTVVRSGHDDLVEKDVVEVSNVILSFVGQK